MIDPPWLNIARSHLGAREVPGKATAPFITRWLVNLGAWWRDDETPWCGVFVGGCLVDAGLPKPKDWYRARAYLDYGVPLARPRVGCIVVFDGGAARPGAGHVAFVVGQDAKMRLMALGGNQADAVSVAPFHKTRVLGYRWPSGVDVPTYSKLPLLASNQKPSENEA